MIPSNLLRTLYASKYSIYIVLRSIIQHLNLLEIAPHLVVQLGEPVSDPELEMAARPIYRQKHMVARFGFGRVGDFRGQQKKNITVKKAKKDKKKKRNKREEEKRKKKEKEKEQEKEKNKHHKKKKKKKKRTN